MTPQLLCVAPHLVETLWPHVVKLIESALTASGSDLTAAAIKAKIDAGKAFLWIVWDAQDDKIMMAGTTELVKLENGRKLCVIGTCAGRRMSAWRHVLRDIERYAAQEGCDAVRFYGRPGWVRAYKGEGYAQPWVVVEKRLS